MNHRVVALCGPGHGAGKTTLAIETAATLDRRRVPVRRLLEADVFEEALWQSSPFAPYVRACRRGDRGNVQVLVSACGRTVLDTTTNGVVACVEEIVSRVAPA